MLPMSPRTLADVGTPNGQADDVALLTHDHRTVRDGGHFSRNSRRLLGGAAVVLVGFTALVITKALTPCVGSHSLLPTSGDFTSLVEVRKSEMESLTHDGDKDLARKWLEETSEAEAETAHEAEPRAQEVVKDAMQTKDVDEARKLVQRAMHRSVAKWHSKRDAMTKFVNANRRTLRHKGKMLKRGDTPQESAIIAECVFNVEQAVTQLAALGASIADAAKTCTPGATWTNTKGKVCIVNLAGIGFAVATVAGSLSVAAENCASTLTPNVDALCAGAISGLGAEVSQLSGMAALTSASCDPAAKANAVGVAPSNWGRIPTGPVANNIPLGAQPVLNDFPLGVQDNATSASARRLLYGGGKGADATQCYVDATSVGWWLAQAGLAINAAANKKAGASCPSKHSLPLRGKALKYAQALCTVDIAGAIYAFGTAIQFLELALTNCPDHLNFNAMCGAGIDGIVASLAGLTSSGSAAWMTCYELRQKNHMKLFNVASIASKLTRGRMPGGVASLDLEGNFGRRLADDDDVKDLMDRFGTPEEAWKSIGYDITDPEADFRRDTKITPFAKDIVSLVEEPTASKEETAGLMQNLNICS